MVLHFYLFARLRDPSTNSSPQVPTFKRALLDPTLTPLVARPATLAFPHETLVTHHHRLRHSTHKIVHMFSFRLRFASIINVGKLHSNGHLCRVPESVLHFHFLADLRDPFNDFIEPIKSSSQTPVLEYNVSTRPAQQAIPYPKFPL